MSFTQLAKREKEKKFIEKHGNWKKMWNHKSCVLLNQFLSRCSISEVKILTRTIIGWENINTAHEPNFLIFRFQFFFSITSRFCYKKTSDCLFYQFDSRNPSKVNDSFITCEHVSNLVHLFYDQTYIENKVFLCCTSLTTYEKIKATEEFVQWFKIQLLHLEAVAINPSFQRYQSFPKTLIWFS